MASNKKPKADQSSEIDEQDESGVATEGQEQALDSAEEVTPSEESELIGHVPASPDLKQLTAIKAEGVHERLEDLELTLMAAPQQMAGSINRVALPYRRSENRASGCDRPRQGRKPALRPGINPRLALI